MNDGQDLRQAKELAAAAIELCDRLGHPIAAAHIQLGLDMMEIEPPSRLNLREVRSPWGQSHEPELP